MSKGYVAGKREVCSRKKDIRNNGASYPAVKISLGVLFIVPYSYSWLTMKEAIWQD